MDLSASGVWYLFIKFRIQTRVAVFSLGPIALLALFLPFLYVCVLVEEGAVWDGVCEQGGVVLLWAILGWLGGSLK